MSRVFDASRYATVTSTLALIIALGGGTAYAAELISSRDIKDGGVKRVDIAKGAVNSGKVADGTLLRGDFKSGQIPSGSQGPAGPMGPAGPAGPAGPSGPVALTYVYSDTLVAEAGEQTGGEVDCPNGQSVTGGGVAVLSTDTAVSVNSSGPWDNDSDPDDIPNNGWVADVNNASTNATFFNVHAICTSASSVH